MSHAIHKIVSIKRCQSYFISRRSPHLGISEDSESCASAHRCLHYAYARLIARVTFHLPIKFHQRIQLCGHIHHPANTYYDGIHYLNSGDWVETLSALTEDEKGNWSIRYFDGVITEEQTEKLEDTQITIAS